MGVWMDDDNNTLNLWKAIQKITERLEKIEQILKDQGTNNE